MGALAPFSPSRFLLHSPPPFLSEWGSGGLRADRSPHSWLQSQRRNLLSETLGWRASFLPISAKKVQKDTYDAVQPDSSRCLDDSTHVRAVLFQTADGDSTEEMPFHLNQEPPNVLAARPQQVSGNVKSRKNK